ncbi:MAG TPA: ABC transporter substrate-binding protein [Chloroflexota bacterium]
MSVSPPRLSRRTFVGSALKVGAALTLAAPLGACQAVSSLTGGSKLPPVRIGYLPITDAAALLVAHAQGHFQAEGLDVEQPTLFRGWSQIAEAFMAGQVNVVHLLMPSAVWMRYSVKYPAKVVAWAHVNGSALTVAGRGIAKLADLGGKRIAVPFWYSIHNVILGIMLRSAGLQVVVQEPSQPVPPSSTNLLVMAPPDMPTALSNGSIDGYIVAEPFNAAGELLAGGRIQRFTGDVWKDHACCVVVMREEDIANRAWSQRVVNAIVRAQQWLHEHTQEGARLLSKDGKGYLPMPADVVTRAMTHYPTEEYGPSGAIRHPEWQIRRIGFQPFPYPSYTMELIRQLKQTHVEGDRAFLDALTPEHAAGDLVVEDLVREAYRSVVSPEAFGLSGERAFTRQEVIDV